MVDPQSTWTRASQKIKKVEKKESNGPRGKNSELGTQIWGGSDESLQSDHFTLFQALEQ